MMQPDEIRGNRIGVMSFLASCEASSLKARSCLIAPSSNGPSFYVSSVAFQTLSSYWPTKRIECRLSPHKTCMSARAPELISPGVVRNGYPKQTPVGFGAVPTASLTVVRLFFGAIDSCTEYSGVEPIKRLVSKLPLVRLEGSLVTGGFMTNLRERPLRLETALTRDYINRPEKMRELSVFRPRWFDHPMVYVFAWVLLGIAFVAALMKL